MPLPEAIDYGLYGIFEARTGNLMTETLAGRYVYALTLDDVREWLTD